MTQRLRWDWTPERKALLRERWPTETPSGEIVLALKELPGDIGTYESAIVKAANMGLRRPTNLGRISNLLPNALIGDVKLKARIAEMWAQELSTAEIGRRCNVTKNKVVGLSRRMGLPRRENPVKARDGKMVHRGNSGATPVRGAAELQQAKERTQRQPAPAPLHVASSQWHATSDIGAALDFPTPERVPAIPQQVTPLAPSPFRRCQWPCGPDTGGVGRHLPLCGNPTHYGTSYCASHAKIAFADGGPSA